MFKRVWDSRPIVAVRAASEVYGIVSMLIAIGGAALVPGLFAGSVAFVGNASGRLVLLVGVGGYVLAVLVVLFLLPLMPVVRKRVKDKELRRQCCKISEGLFTFLTERAPDHPQKKYEATFLNPSEEDTGELLQDAVRYNTETESQYEQRFGREVERLLDASERRGWSSVEDQKKLEARWWSMELPDDRIRRIAQHLENVCHNA